MREDGRIWGRRAAVIVVCLLTLATTACNSGGSDSSLREGLTFAAPDLTLFRYTDRAEVREFAGAEDLDADAGEDELATFRQALNVPDSPLFTAFGGYRFPDHRENWGWNELDVNWEAQVTSEEEPPVTVIALNDDFDLEEITSKLEERDYTAEELEGATLYTIDDIFAVMEETEADPAMASVAVLEDENIIVVGEGAETAVETHADEESSVVSEVSFEALADRFGNAAGVGLVQGEICNEGLGPRATPQMEAVFDEFRGNPYQALALAFTVEGEGESAGTIAMHYEDSADAESDIEVRENALTEGTSLVSNQPYDELLEVTEATVDGNDLVIEVAAVDGNLPLVDMLVTRDLGFALC